MTIGSERLAQDLKLETLTGPARALAEEAVRIKARLDSLDLWVNGDAGTWMDLADRLGRTELIITAPLVEARQQAMTLARVLGELAKQQVATSEPAKPAASALDEIKARRERKRAQEA